MILHIDMDYFFAQVEERENPEFKNKPVVVGSDPKKGTGRGVVSTANYKAREFGIKSGMPISFAYKKCSDAIFLPVNQKLYSRVSENIFRIIEDITKNYQTVGYDEAYLDISSVAKNYDKAKECAVKLKKLILQKENLTCSIGIAESKMIAKIASESDKPNGLVAIKPKDSLKFIADKKIREIPGVGPKTEKELEKIINKKNLKIKDVRSLSEKELEVLGKRGLEIYQKVRAIDNSKIEINKKIKSISKEKTFEKDTLDSEEIINTFKKLTEEVSKNAIDKKLKINSITAICRFSDFKTFNKQISFNSEKPDSEFIYKKGVNLLLRLLTNKSKPIRLIGVRVGISVD